MRNSKGVSLIALIITIIVIIILAAIVLSSGGDTTNRAQLAVFTNNFSQYNDRVVMDSLNVKQTLGIRSENVNDAQLYYMVANGLRTASGDSEVTNRTLPVGYVMPKTIREIFKISVPEAVVAYVIDDKNITGYGANGNNTDASAGYEFYGDTNGEEYHFITSAGQIFTVPGFALPLEDGTIQYYISNEKGAYYVCQGNFKGTVELGKTTNLNGDVINEADPILATDFLNDSTQGSTAHPAETGTGMYGLTSRNSAVTKYGDVTTDPLKDAAGNDIKPQVKVPADGRRTVIGAFMEKPHTTTTTTNP